MRTQHRDWYLAWIEAMPLELLSRSQSALRVAIGEIDNLRAAADWCVSNDQPQLLARLSTRLSDYWALGGAYEEGRRWLSEALRGGDQLATPEKVACHVAAARHLAGATTRQIPFRTPGSLSLHRHYLPVIRAGLGGDEARRARDEGQAMTLDVALAYALEGLG